MCLKNLIQTKNYPRNGLDRHKIFVSKRIFQFFKYSIRAGKRAPGEDIINQQFMVSHIRRKNKPANSFQMYMLLYTNSIHSNNYK